jgi:hypothetical protein
VAKQKRGLKKKGQPFGGPPRPVLPQRTSTQLRQEGAGRLIEPSIRARGKTEFRGIGVKRGRFPRQSAQDVERNDIA